jgi:putative redox protein
VATESRRAGPAALKPAALKDLYERKARALHRRPELARGAGHTRVRLGNDGLACLVEGSDRQVQVDLAPADGGTGTAAGPSDLMRASLGACLAMDYRLWAARLDVPLGAVEIDLVAEFDERGALLTETEIRPGWRRLTCAVTIQSAAPAVDVARVVEVANAHCPGLANLSPAIERVHALTVVPSPTERERSVTGHALDDESD